MKTTITANNLSAALLAAGKNDVRYYLNGVLLEVTATRTRLVATDGHRLHFILAAPEGNEAGEAVIIPRDLIEPIVKGGKRAQELPVTIEAEPQDSGAAMLKLTRADGFSVSGPAIDGKFPDYQRAIPQPNQLDPDQGEGQFNPAYLLDIRKAADLMGAGPRLPIHVFHRGPVNVALVLHPAAPYFFAVLMPMRSDARCKDNEALRELFPAPAYWYEEDKREEAA